MAKIDTSPLSLDGAGVASLEVIELVVGSPVGDEVITLAVEGAAARGFLRPAGALELDEAAEPALAVGDEEGLPVGREGDAAQRAEKVEDAR